MDAVHQEERAQVALVFPYFRTRERTELLFPPLGLAALKARLAALGVRARVLDGTFRSPRDVIDELVASRPAVVGISVMVSLSSNALRIAAAVHERLPEALIVAGGPLPTVFPARFASHVDAVFRGEADVSFPRFCRDYLAGAGAPRDLRRLDLRGYAGLVVDRDGLRVDVSPVHHTAEEIAAFAPPDRGDFDHAAYQREWAPSGSRPTSLLATFGCPYHCEFCSKPVFGDEVRRRPLEDVTTEIGGLRRLGYDALWIADDTFTLSATYLEEFCRRVAPLGVTWSCLSRADGVSATTARAMRAAGCRRVYLGLESGSRRTLEMMRKRVSVDDGARTAAVYRAAGIGVAAFFIVGYPGETVADVEQTFALALDLPLDEISFNVPMPLPGSALWERLALDDPQRDWTHENDATLVFDSDFDERWLRRRIAETTEAFTARARGRPARVAGAVS
jgi:anaerobic magnesium-protoporphyrin IX monomethyl ester cyclase